MKNLYDYLKECEGLATPANTLGAGNPILPGTNGELGSGDVITKEKPIKKKKLKSNKRSQIK